MSFSTEIRERRAFVSEIKYLIPRACAGAVRDWARARLSPDPYGSGPFGDTYRTTSLYFDTKDFAVFHRRGSFGRSKYRIRRYGSADVIFLERKMKTHDWVGKRRSIVRTHELPRLGAGPPEKGWAGYWFHRRILARELDLVCRISYCRTALIGEGEDPIRMTIDTELHATPADRIEFRHSGDGREISPHQISPNHAILELKYRSTPPPVFQELIETFSLAPQPVSKYRMAISAMGYCTQPAAPLISSQMNSEVSTL
jgi:hypothetical protein